MGEVGTNRLILIGAGGHARVLADALHLLGRAEGAVVLVANSSGKRNAAQKRATELGNLGFSVQGVTNGALYEESLDVSKIYVKPGGEPAAESIARLMGGIAVLRMPTPVWITGGPDALGYANVLVMLGADNGGLTLAEMDD